MSDMSNEEAEWNLVIKGFGVTPTEEVFEVPPGARVRILKDGEWTYHKGKVTVPKGVHMRLEVDPHHQNRKARRAAERQAKAERVAKAVIKKAKHG